MAASSAFADPAVANPKLIPITPSSIGRSGYTPPPVVRTEIHAMHTGRGGRSVRRRISPSAGFALEILGHAIEYMADEYAHSPGSLPGSDPSKDSRVEALQMLMAANRQVYYACPVVPSFWERLATRLLVLTFFIRLVLSGHGDRTQRTEAQHRRRAAERNA